MKVVAMGMMMKIVINMKMKVMILMMEQEITSLIKHIIGKQWVVVKMKVRQVNNDNQSVSATDQIQQFLWGDALYYTYTVIIKWKEK